MTDGVPRLPVIATIRDVGRVANARLVAVIFLAACFSALPQGLIAASEYWYTHAHRYTWGVYFALTAYHYLVASPFNAILICGCVLIAAPVLDPDVSRPTIRDTIVRYGLPSILLQLVLAILTLAGLALLIVPAFMISTAVYVSAPSLILEDLSVRRAIDRSRELTRGDRWRVFAIITIVCTPLWIVAYGVYPFLPISPALPATKRYIVAGVRGALLYILELPSWLAIPAIYFRLRQAKGGAKTVAVFD